MIQFLSRLLCPKAWLGAALLALASCGSAPAAPASVLPEASAAFGRARELRRDAQSGWRAAATAEAQRALEIDANWVAPRRFLDDIEYGDLMGHAALARHVERLALEPTEVRAGYLAGRLEGVAGGPRFRAGASADPQGAWILHGRAWLQSQHGNHVQAASLERLALAAARDSWERTYFSLSGAHHSLRAGEEIEALGWLDERLIQKELSAQEIRTLLLELARVEMELEPGMRRSQGCWHAIAILKGYALTSSELRTLMRPLLALLARGQASISQEELQSALAIHDTAARRRMRASLLFDAGARTLALGLLDSPGASDSVALRAERVARGGLPALIEEWNATLPSQVQADDDLPRRSELREVVLRAREANDPKSRAALGRALLDAGWFLEAQQLANALALEDLPSALDLESQAGEGRAILLGIEHIFEVLDDGLDYAGPRHDREDPSAFSVPGKATAISTLGQLLSAFQPLFVSHGTLDEHDFEESPRLPIGPFATLLHPGPNFSVSDEQRGLGKAGQPVPGLAASLASMGRFGVFGTALGSRSPDGTILRILDSEDIAGEHLGVSFSGNRIWCEGADLGSKPARHGARIAGAALHEGYWIDVAEVRRSLVDWQALEVRFFGTPDARAERALAAQGPRLPGMLASQGFAQPQMTRRHDAQHRQSAYAPLGEGDRIRLAVLMDRRAALGLANEAAGSSMTLEELLEVTARHEEGHLTDQTRFLPLGEHFFEALGFLIQVGFSGNRLAEELEYRAQLISLCVSADPRLPLAEAVTSLESNDDLTPHNAAYRRLVADFLVTLESNRELSSRLDSSRYWVHQLHHLSPGEVRELARSLARRRGLLRQP